MAWTPKAVKTQHFKSNPQQLRGLSSLKSKITVVSFMLFLSSQHLGTETIFSTFYTSIFDFGNGIDNCWRKHLQTPSNFSL